MRSVQKLNKIEDWLISQAKQAHDAALDASGWDSGLFVSLCGRAEAFEETLEYIQGIHESEWNSSALVE